MHVNCADFVYKAKGELIQVLYLISKRKLYFSVTILMYSRRKLCTNRITFVFSLTSKAQSQTCVYTSCCEKNVILLTQALPICHL